MALCSLAVLYQWDHFELAASTWWRPIQERGFWLIASGAHNPMVDSMSALSNAPPSFLKERRLSRSSSSKRRSISSSLETSRPDWARAPAPRRGQSRRSRRRRALTPSRGAGAPWTGSRWVSASWSRPWSGMGTPGARLQSEGLLRRARRVCGCRSFLRRLRHGALRSPTSRDQSSARPRQGNRGERAPLPLAGQEHGAVHLLPDRPRHHRLVHRPQAAPLPQLRRRPPPRGRCRRRLELLNRPTVTWRSGLRTSMVRSSGDGPASGSAPALAKARDRATSSLSSEMANLIRSKR